MNQHTPKRRGPITLLRESRRFRFLVMLATCLAVLYVASFGPAYWWQHSSESRIITVVYAPLVETAWHFPTFVMDGMWWYATCAVSDNGKRLGCSPLWRGGPRALSWLFPVAVPVNPPAPNPEGTSR